MAEAPRYVTLALACLLLGEASAKHGMSQAAPGGMDNGTATHEVLTAAAPRDRGHAPGCGPQDQPLASNVLSSDVFQMLDFVKGVVNGDWANFLRHLANLSMALWAKLLGLVLCAARRLVQCLRRLRWPYQRARGRKARANGKKTSKAPAQNEESETSRAAARGRPHAWANGA